MYRRPFKRGLAVFISSIVSASTWAQVSPDMEVETIVVTAELLDRALHNSGNSISVFDEDAIRDRAGLLTLRDILDSVSNLSVVTGTGKAPSVRGVDGTGPAENANAFFAGSRPRLSWRIDGRPASYNEVVFGDLGLSDIERVEVLRGPQSTLVGRNAIAGTVIVKTHDPQFESQTSLQAAAGDYNQQQVSGTLNLPLINERVALRLSADWLQKDSSVSYDPFPGVDDPARIEGLSLRAKLLYVPDSERESRLLLNLSHRSYSGPNGEIIVRPFEHRRSNFPMQPRHEPEYNSLGADYSLQLSSDWAFQLNVSATDFDFTRSAVPGTSSATIDTRELVAEPQLRYHNNIQVVTGLYYFRARQDEFIEFWGGQNFDDYTDTLAAYTESSIPLSDTIDLSLGLRYEDERRRRSGGDVTGNLVQIFADETHQALLPKAGISWQPVAGATWGMQISKGYNAGGSGITFVFPIVNYNYKKETAWTYELFGRQQFANGRLSTTQNLFYSRYKDMQLPFDLTPDDSTDEAFVVRNADDVRTHGLELGLTATLTESWRIYGNMAWLNTQVHKFPNSGIEGNELLTAPDVTASLGILWQHGRWQTSLNSRYSAGYFSDVNNRPRGKTDAYVVADAQLAYDNDQMRWFASVKNLFDSEKALARYPGVVPAGSTMQHSALDSAVLLQPRMLLIGVQISY